MSVERDNHIFLIQTILKPIQTLSGIKFHTFHPNNISLRPSLPEGVSSKEQIHIGGSGITERNLADIELELPGVRQRALGETGHIVFIGNGLSPAPLEIIAHHNQQEAEASEKASLHHPPTRPRITLVDLYYYAHLLEDLRNVHHTLLQNKIPANDTLLRQLDTCLEIDRMITRNRVHSERYFFGSGNVPESLIGKAQLVVNCFGPNHTTLKEQLQLLAVGGELYTNQVEFKMGSHPDIIPGYDLGRKQNGKGHWAYVIRRLSSKMRK